MFLMYYVFNDHWPFLFFHQYQNMEAIECNKETLNTHYTLVINLFIFLSTSKYGNNRQNL